MKKNVYSVMLAEDVVNEIDRLADERGITRSGFINEVLAEYVSVTTPERLIRDVFKRVEALMPGADDLPVFFGEHDNTLSIKSALEYRYRPTIRYEVELYRSPGGSIGELTVNFRTQSPALLAALTEFFGLWRRMEEIYVSSRPGGEEIEYSLDDNKWTRSLALPRGKQYSAAELGRAITDYIRAFDKLLKRFVTGGSIGAEELENAYLAELNAGRLII